MSAPTSPSQPPSPGDPAAGPPEPKLDGAAGAVALPRPKRRRAVRITGWSLFVIVLLVVATLSLVIVVLRNLDSPTVATWVQDTVVDDFGLGLEYDQLSVQAFGGELHATNLRIRTPEPYTKHAPYLLQLERLDVKWDFWSLTSDKPLVSKIELSGLSLHQVTDEHGGSSVAKLAEQFATEEPPPPEEPAAPLSRLIAETLPPIEVQAIDLSDISVELVDIENDTVIRRTQLGDLCVRGPFRVEAGALATDIHIGGCDDDKLAAVITEPGPGADADTKTRRLDLRLGTDIRAPARDTIELAVNADLVGQDLVPAAELPDEIVRLGIATTFDPQNQRTTVRMATLRLLDGAATAELAATLNDRPEGAIAPALDRLSGHVDGARMLGYVSAFVPGVTLTDTELSYDIRDLAIDLDRLVVERGRVTVEAKVGAARAEQDEQRVAVSETRFRLDADLQAPLGGKLDSELQVGRVELLSATGEQVTVAGLTLTAGADEFAVNPIEPVDSRGTLRVRAGLEQLDLDQPETNSHVGVRGLGFETEVGLGERAAVTGKLPIERVELSQGKRGPSVELAGLSLEWNLADLDPDFAQPADASVSVRLASAKLRDRGQRVDLAQIGVDVGATVRSPESFDLRVDIPLGKVVARADGATVDLRDAQLGLVAEQVELDPEAPERANAQVRFSSRLPRLDLATPEMRVAGRRLGVNLRTRVAGGLPRGLSGSVPIGSLEVRDLAAGEDLARIQGGELSWDASGLAVDQNDPMRSNGRVKVKLALPKLALSGGTELSIPAADIDLGLRGGRRSYDAKARVRLASLAMDGTQHDTALITTVEARADLRKPAVDFAFSLHGQDRATGPDLDAKLSASYARGPRRLDYQLDIVAENLGPLEGFLPPEVRAEHKLAWDDLRLDVKGQGQLAGLIRRFVDGGTTPVLADDPVTAVRGKQELSLDLTGLDYRGPDQRAKVPQLALRFEADKGDAIAAKLALNTERITLVSEDQRIDVVDLQHTFDLSSEGTSPERGRLTLDTRTQVAKVEQPFIGYPIEDAQITVRGHVDQLASLRLDELRVENPAGGTLIEASAAADRLVPGAEGASGLPGRQALAAKGMVRQDLSRVVLPGGPRLSGRFELPFEVESGDLTAFQVAVRAEFDDVGVDMPEAGVRVAGFDGNIPLVAGVALLPDGRVVLLEGPTRNLYSRTRFLDVHPFLRGRHFLAIREVEVMGTTISPIAGNLRFERDTLALDQLELGVLGGQVSGQLVVDIRNQRPRLLFRGNATGLHPGGSKEVLDANATVTFVPTDLALEGSIQVLRMSRAHLYAILDVIDPYHEDVSVNRARLGLKVGYPEFLRIRMKDGFLAAKLDLGGAAGAVRIDEITGIALGPLLNLYVAPYLDLDLGLGGSPPGKETDSADGAPEGAPEATDDDPNAPDADGGAGQGTGSGTPGQGS
ncbi:hypothetical protein [Haliangium sp.]|uniref:hypothetical protein n=1 Tax=Haliangium sp. TaxID=2663208 RepID=UPI003D0E76E2